MPNIQNIDQNKCFKWCLVRYLHPPDHHPAGIRNVDKDFAREFDFKDIKFLVKIRGIHKIKKIIALTLVLLALKEKKKYSIYVSKNTFRRHINLLLIGKQSKRRYVLMKDFDTFMHYVVEENIFVVIVYRLLV